MKKIGFILCLFIFSMSCNNPTESNKERTGAVCNDGTTTTATGSGACSNHGGVNHWTYK